MSYLACCMGLFLSIGLGFAPSVVMADDESPFVEVTPKPTPDYSDVNNPFAMPSTVSPDDSATTAPVVTTPLPKSTTQGALRMDFSVTPSERSLIEFSPGSCAVAQLRVTTSRPVDITGLTIRVRHVGGNPVDYSQGLRLYRDTGTQGFGGTGTTRDEPGSCVMTREFPAVHTDELTCTLHLELLPINGVAVITIESVVVDGVTRQLVGDHYIGVTTSSLRAPAQAPAKPAITPRSPNKVYSET